MRYVERKARVLRSSGMCTKLLKRASAETRRLAAGVNGPLFELLADQVGFADPMCIDFFRYGTGCT